MGSAFAKPTARQAHGTYGGRATNHQFNALYACSGQAFHPHSYPIGFVSTRGSSRCNSPILWMAACTSASVNSALMATLAW
jgi:hypothetical protein